VKKVNDHYLFASGR